MIWWVSQRHVPRYLSYTGHALWSFRRRQFAVQAEALLAYRCLEVRRRCLYGRTFREAGIGCGAPALVSKIGSCSLGTRCEHP